MDDTKRKKIIAAVLVAVIGVAAIIVGIMFTGNPGGSKSSALGTPAVAPTPAPLQGITEVASPRTVYESALAKAVAWHSDAGLIKMTLSDAAAGTWTLTFIAPVAKGKGYQVSANAQGVLSANEIAYAGSGAALPTDVISPDAAMAAARAVPGYGNGEVVSMELIYNASAKHWYWGVGMASGATVTISATN